MPVWLNGLQSDVSVIHGGTRDEQRRLVVARRKHVCQGILDPVKRDQQVTVDVLPPGLFIVGISSSLRVLLYAMWRIKSSAF